MSTLISLLVAVSLVASSPVAAQKETMTQSAESALRVSAPSPIAFRYDQTRYLRSLGATGEISLYPLATACGDCGGGDDPLPDPEEDEIDWGNFPRWACFSDYRDQCAPFVPVGEPISLSEITTYSGLPTNVTVETPTTCSYEDGAVTVFQETNALEGGWQYDPQFYTDAPSACKISVASAGNDEWLPTSASLTLIAGTPQHVEITISRDGISRSTEEPARVGDTVSVRTWFEGDIRIRGGGSYRVKEGPGITYTVPSCRTIVETAGGIMTLTMDVEPGGAGCTGEFVIPEPDLSMRARVVTSEAGCQNTYGEFITGGVWDLAFYVVALPELRARRGAGSLRLPAYVDNERETSVPNSCFAFSNQYINLVNRQGINSAVFLQSLEVRPGDRADHEFSSSDKNMISWDLRDWGAEQFEVNSDWVLPLQNLSDYVDFRGDRCISDLGLSVMFGDDIFESPPSYYTIVVPDERCTEIMLHVPGPLLSGLSGGSTDKGTLYIVLGQGATQMYVSFDLAPSDQSPRLDGAAAVLLTDVAKIKFITEGSQWMPEFYVGPKETCRLEVRNARSHDPRTFNSTSDTRGICAFDIAWEDLPSDESLYVEGQNMRYFELSTNRLGQTDIGYTSFSDILTTVAPPELPTFSNLEEGEDGSLAFTIDTGVAPLVEVLVDVADEAAPESRSAGSGLRATAVESMSDPIIDGCDVEIVTAEGEALYLGGEEFEDISVVCPPGTGPEDVNVTSINASGTIASGTIADSLVPATFSGILSIAGDAQVDGALRIGSGLSWSGGNAEFQWYLCDSAIGAVTEAEDAPAGCDEVEGSESRTRYLDETDYGAYSVVSVSVENEYGGRKLFSASSRRITGTPPRLWGDLPSITGTAALRMTMSAGSGEWRGWPEPSVRYSWLRCRSSGAATDMRPSGCRVIRRASQSVYRTSRDDLRMYLRLQVTVTNSSGSTTYFSQTTERVERR